MLAPELAPTIGSSYESAHSVLAYDIVTIVPDATPVWAIEAGIPLDYVYQARITVADGVLQSISSPLP